MASLARSSALKKLLAVSVGALLAASAVHGLVQGGEWVFSVAVPLGVLVLLLVWGFVGESQLSSSTGFQHRIDELQKRLNVQDDFFQTLNNNTPSTLAIYDKEGSYWFVNASAAKDLGVSENDILGKKPVEILGAERGRKILRNLERVGTVHQAFEVLDQFVDAGGILQHTRTRYHRLDAFGEFHGGVMAHGENITSFVVEREKREGTLRQVISTLVAVVDRRDPYASGHSLRVGQLSRALAEEMRLSDGERDTAEIAGSLMNFGKVLVSRAILTKTEALTPDELQRIRDSIMTSAEILSRIEFGMPVVPTLRQVLERFDGTGVPNNLAGEAILVSARIVAVANAFVALVSPRAYRDGADFISASQKLSKDAGGAFDPRVTAALESYLQKNAARLEWLSVAKV